MFEPGARSTGTDIAGQDAANPSAMINAAIDLLQHLGHLEHAKAISVALYKTITEDKIHTPGL